MTRKIYNSITEMVGHTPLLRLNRLVKKFKLKSELLGKCEAYNPFFSIKDRVALKMIEDAEKKGLINDSTVFLEATSGNTGIALAALCAAKGYKLVITMPENMSSERIKLMKHFGAEVILTPKEDGMNGSIKKAELLAEKNPNVIMLKQFENQANPDAHKLSTSVEILEDTGYNAINQMVGYLMSGDPGFITSNKEARSRITKYDRSKILEYLVRKSLQK